MKNVNCAFQRLFVAVGFLLLFSGCVSFQVGGDIQKGRLALMYGDPNVALEHFQRAANSDPNYLLDFSIFDEGAWTYVGNTPLTTPITQTTHTPPIMHTQHNT